MKKLKFITLAIVANLSVLSNANANETIDISLSLTHTIDTLLQQNIEDLQPLNLAEETKLLIVSNTANKDLNGFEMKDAEKVNNNAAKLTE
ncbi:hypothetical protein [Aliiglaciecola lipolytica]|nr:hypothetical protein [Aliiglaciecola lipolytica]